MYYIQYIIMKKIIILLLSLFTLFGCAQKTQTKTKTHSIKKEVKTYSHNSSFMTGNAQNYVFSSSPESVTTNSRKISIHKASDTSYNLVALKSGKARVSFKFKNYAYVVIARIYDKKELQNMSQMPVAFQDYAKKYQEHTAFVLGYTQAKQNESGTPDISWEINEYVNHGQVPYFYQNDERWGYRHYGNSYMAISSCGPTALSIVYTALTKKADRDPYTLALYSNNKGYYAYGKGTKVDLMTTGARKIGLKVTDLANNALALDAALNAHQLVIMDVGAGDFTTSGHYLVIVGKQNNQLIIRDPNSRANTAKLWDENRVLSQSKLMWSYNL